VRCAAKLTDEEERADLIEFLRLYTKNLAITLRKRAADIYGKEYVNY
jgi:hypothetical protein